MEEIREEIERVVGEIFQVEEKVEMMKAPENTGADFSTNVAMKLAGKLHKNPMEIAEEIVNELRRETSPAPFYIEVAAPGFINFISSDEYIWGKVGGFWENGEFSEKNISNMIYSGKKVVVEFSDPNPFKVLHVGHFYTSVVGDAMARMIERAGGEVKRVNFGGDVGLHVAKTIFALREAGISAEELTIEKIAECYVLGSRAYEEDEAAKNEIVKLNKEIYQEGEKNEIYRRGREISYQYFKDFYRKIGVEFDRFYPESEVAGTGVSKVQEGLRLGVYEKSDGAVIFPGEKYGLHTRVFINKEGLPTYETKDVGLIFRKNEDYHFDRSIVITGNDIVEYMKVVLKSVSMIPGGKELAEKTTHITHGNVKLPGHEKMSSRKGNFIKAEEVLKETCDKLDGNLALAIAAIKYAFLKYKVGRDFDFDIDESVSMTGNSGVYLLYTVVRAKKILSDDGQGEARPRHASRRPVVTGGARYCSIVSSSMSRTGFPPLFSVYEKALAKKVGEWGGVVERGVRELAPSEICKYLFELSQEFSRFYENCKVRGDEREELRLVLVATYYNIMISGLKLIGIEDIPEEM